MRILALDHGSKRIGLAVSDETGSIALPLEFVPAQPEQKLFQRLIEIVAQKEIGELVVGIPRNMNGTYGPAAEKAREFAAALKTVLTLPVREWDERLTSAQANRALLETGIRREQRRQKVDETAAAILLQSFLDRRSL